ncbi:MAG TPA: phospholipase D family protein [Ferruginibacter sp.]|jgi:HKD family nuclease|nr:phospholipase D family protein [Ferruginibacter sp.]
MKLLTTQSDLEREFIRLISQYKEFYWATAWAGESRLLNELLLNKAKIKRIVVGIHFYQTHPNFISEFLNEDRVRFIQQPSGTFHPKIYIFLDTENKWEMLVGSANFTHQAFTNNTEATILLTSKDNNSNDSLENGLKMVDENWKSGKVFNKKELDQYRITWNIQEPKLKSLSGLYGSKEGNPKPIYKASTTIRSWEEFITELKKDKLQELGMRLRVIEISRALFHKSKHFNLLNEDERKFIAGIPNKLDVRGAENWGLFGSMKGAGIFKNRIKENDINISKALDQIPLFGEITKTHYDNFINHFTKTFTGNYVGTATRLLLMKRPDIFICFDSKNKSELCKDFGILQSGMNYERYWEDIVKRIYDSNWWLFPNPKNLQETKVCEARAAFLDSLYYNE